ncbi:MAG TPA: TolC family protein, partial [Polyangiaceae bacterium]
MKHSPLRLPLAATALLCASIAAAQPAPAPAPAPATAPEPSPALPVIDDPMLKPPPPALNTLTTWREALRMVRARSTSLKTSIAEIEVANGLAREALAGSLPRLTGSAGITQDLHPDRKTFWDASLRLSVPLFAPKEWYDSATARREIEIARLNNRDQERLLLGSVAEAIVSVITAERLAEVSRVSLASALSTLDLNRRRERLGAANAIDVLRTEQE